MERKLAEYIIEREEDAFRFLSNALDGYWNDSDIVKFSGWPKFELIIRGEKFDGGVPTRIMPLLIEVQRLLNNIYARQKYGKHKRLSQEERSAIEIIVRLSDEHSTYFGVDLDKVLNGVCMEGIKKMSGTQITIVILGIAIIIGGYQIAKLHYQDLADERNLELSLEQSEREQQTLERIQQAADRSEDIKMLLSELGAVYELLIKKLEPEDELIVGEEAIVNGAIAKKLTRKPREAAIETRKDGSFEIQSVDTQAIEGGFRLKVKQVGLDEKPFVVDIPPNTLNKEQIEALQTGEWQRKPVTLRINVRTIGKRMLKATLIEAGIDKF